MTSPELRALTSVRGLAAWLVVLFHIRGSMAGLPAAAKAVLAKGYLAVDFFFLLSGFGWPLLIAGLLKSGYDLALLALFSHVRPPEEREAARARAPTGN